MKKYIFSSAVFLMLILAIVIINRPGNNGFVDKPITINPQLNEEQSITELLESVIEGTDESHFVLQAVEQAGDGTSVNEHLLSNNKLKKVTKEKLENKDLYADALDKKVARDIKEISANYPEEVQGEKDEIDDEMIGLLSDSEEVAGIEY